MNTDPVVNFYIRPDGRFGRSPALPDGVILLATGRQSLIDALVRHTALRDEQAKCYRLPLQPERVAGVPNDLTAAVGQYIDSVRGNPLGKSIKYEVIKP